MKFAIIGANSYIARNLIYILKNKYKEIECKLYGRADKHADSAENYTCVNLFDSEDIKRIDLSCDAVFIFVGKTGSANGFDDFDTFIDSNEKSLLNILNLNYSWSHNELLNLQTL